MTSLWIALFIKNDKLSDYNTWLLWCVREECMWGCILSNSFTTMKLNPNLMKPKSEIQHDIPWKYLTLFSLVIYRILVGAPTAESVMQPGLRKAGAVYRCSSTQSDSCQQLPFDRQGMVHDVFLGLKKIHKTSWIEEIDKTKWEEISGKWKVDKNKNSNLTMPAFVFT